MPHKLITQNQFTDSLTQYGDGVFETMLAVGNDIHHWDYHWQRLEKSCQRLQISVPEYEKLYQQLQITLTEQNNTFSVIKMIIARGDGLRGYRSIENQPCYIQFSISDYHFNPKIYQGLNVRICQTRLSHQPLLAGMKHINRLEYVMARRESEDGQFDEGLLLNYDNLLIEGLTSNVFIIKNQHIFTPILDGSGVCGTMRAYLRDTLPSLGYMIKEKALLLDDIGTADEIFLTNATAGIMPVSRIAGINKTFQQTITNSIRYQVGHPCSQQ
ncbi:MAG: aminodeoxychorismate lyase [Gammaproteobacteria bacterium]|nr:MAG: aminodeoxychorismate lyase [Gammaproteobacteria bacterium]